MVTIDQVNPAKRNTRKGRYEDRGDVFFDAYSGSRYVPVVSLLLFLIYCPEFVIGPCIMFWLFFVLFYVRSRKPMLSFISWNQHTRSTFRDISYLYNICSWFIFPVIDQHFLKWLEKFKSPLGHNVRKGRLMNTIVVSFNTLMGQMTEMFQRKKKPSKPVSIYKSVYQYLHNSVRLKAVASVSVSSLGEIYCKIRLMEFWFVRKRF